MTNFRDILTSEQDVAMFPDPETAEDLRKLRVFWARTGAEETAEEPDLSALSDAEIAEQLEALRVTDTEMPAQIRNLVGAPQESWPWKRGLAVAACLAGGIAIGVFVTMDQEGDPANAVPDQLAASGPEYPDAPALDPYLVQPRGPVPQVAPPEETELDIRTVRLPGRGERLDLNRAELRELQVLLNRFDYGPVAQLGLPSADTDRAITRFRQAHDLAEGGADLIVLGILRELAHEEALQNLNDQANENQQPKGDTP